MDNLTQSLFYSFYNTVQEHYILNEQPLGKKTILTAQEQKKTITSKKNLLHVFQ